MIFKRFAANLRAQNWSAILIELGIVIVGVFIGTWVANWNQERAEQRDTHDLLIQLRPEMDRFQLRLESARTYYATTARYAEIAFAGWRGDPAVTDAQFVIAAYQASQAYGIAGNGQSWSMIFGGDKLRRIENPAIRGPLLRLMTFDYSLVGADRIFTRYRDNVRLVIPNEIQQRIRAACGDRNDPTGETLQLAATCRIDISMAASAAADLRANPGLVGELAQHQAAVSTQLININQLSKRVDALDREIQRLD